MNEEQKDLMLKKAEQVSSVKRSFSQSLRDVEARIEWEHLPRAHQARGRELAMIMAEIERLPPYAQVRVDGEDHDAAEVAEIYRMLTHDHICVVLEQLDEIDYRVKAMKTYLRTALYNIVFTIENLVDNDVKHGF